MNKKKLSYTLIIIGIALVLILSAIIISNFSNNALTTFLFFITPLLISFGLINLTKLRIWIKIVLGIVIYVALLIGTFFLGWGINTNWQFYI